MSRTIQLTVKIAAPPESVWRMLSEAEGLTRWFVPEARVEPGLGGKIFLSWGPGMEGEGPIHLWEPERALGWTEAHPGRPVKQVEFRLEKVEAAENAEAQTILNLEHSGFGEEAEFDAEFESTSGGWRTFLSILAYGVSVHGIRPCTQVTHMVLTTKSRAEMEHGLEKSFSVEPGFSQIPVGGAFQAKIADLGEVSGQRIAPDKPGYYLIGLENWDRSLVAFFFEDYGGQIAVTSQWFLYGEAQAKAVNLRRALENALAA